MDTIVYLSLGTNKGHREHYLREGIRLINSLVGSVQTISSFYESSSWGYKDRPYLNCVIMIRSDLSADQILRKTQEIEIYLGRKSKSIFRKGKVLYKAREIDIDILLYGNEIIQEPDLLIPHISLHKRRFVLVPLNEIAPCIIHPILKKNIEILLEECTDKEKVEFFLKVNFKTILKS